MSTFEPFAAALRLSGVAVSQKDLDAALKQSSTRFEPEDADTSHYAQIDLDVTNPVRAILDLAETSGAAIAAMLDDRRIGKAVLDIAFDYPPEGEAMSARLPAHAAAAIASHGIDIEISVYLTDVEDDEE
ncbi:MULTISPECIES: hypothetical protein [unclassified Devosia]|uniref:hypothetical protein n=1 Tax=unclassified Devosia TaxID=196773 RepID=UPI0015FA30E5|nr:MULTISPECIES: hypothetical protein [unclassified Devosia]MBJ6986027.1 hypothetical protein [Devosia sp. MC521]MBJ7578949.1 hypothetical protein [Devosia sp. MC532]MBK1793513.1 hypothetical protein [Devosia sp. WQ 349K1]QMW61398.1 hypothetical protein H4N61_10420 [Devosia sp. MC521]